MTPGFKFIDRQEALDALKVNDGIKVKKMTFGDFSYHSVDNFFKTPEKAIEVLRHYPALSGGVYTPGARQNFTPMDLVPVLKAYKEILAHVGKEVDPTRFISASNIVWKGVEVWKNSWIPHTDYDLVCNLWLCDYEGGTAIYKYKGLLSDKDITPEVLYARELDRTTLVPWQNFDGDDDWELYCVIPSQFNTVAIYDGSNFHGTYAIFNEEYRYSLISFYQPERSFA